MSRGRHTPCTRPPSRAACWRGHSPVSNGAQANSGADRGRAAGRAAQRPQRRSRAGAAHRHPHQRAHGDRLAGSVGRRGAMPPARGRKEATMTATRPLRFGIQAGVTDTPYAERRAYWREAERLGYDWASVSDHFMANPAIGARDTDPWLEAWTALAALAEATERIRLGVLVTSVGYRHPALLAKMAATLDVICGGRLEFGLGAGYLEAEYRMYGIPFPPAPVRIAQLDEAQVEAEVARFAAQRGLPLEQARQWAIAGTPEEVAAQLAPYVGLGFDTFLLLERTPLDHETLRLFMQEVAPRLRAQAGTGV